MKKLNKEEIKQATESKDKSLLNAEEKLLSQHPGTMSNEELRAKAKNYSISHMTIIASCMLHIIRLREKIALLETENKVLKSHIQPINNLAKAQVAAKSN